MNQASRKSWLVAVLPAACQPEGSPSGGADQATSRAIIAFIMLHISAQSIDAADLLVVLVHRAVGPFGGGDCRSRAWQRAQ
jgi:hypothetical protein